MGTTPCDEDWFISNDETKNTSYSFPALESIGFAQTVDKAGKQLPLVLELIPLPLLSENNEQMPVGARGWYASAVLSAMMMVACSRNSNGGREGESGEGVLPNDGSDSRDSSGSRGIDLMREDLKRAFTHSNLKVAKTGRNDDNIFLELGSGTIGLSGMAMAWILAQLQQKTSLLQEDISCSNNKVVLTDYDEMCLKQLERNAEGTRQALSRYFSESEFSNECGDGKENHNASANKNTSANGNNRIAPDIDVAHLDWNEYDQDQSPVLWDKDNSSSGDGADESNQRGIVSFACGAALVYTEATSSCANQVAKLLRLHPQCVVWVVQWPRGGWFSVFQQELTSKRNERDGLQIRVEKFGPESSPELFSDEIQGLASTLMPESMQQEGRMDIKYLRAVRITNHKDTVLLSENTKIGG
ncbi:unnamed protein product [Pseudo-nitzschia multistriata]|uniref:Uncharacterized protein n=1 Tax=Pseudo-nitzschia multistriata TaxID=183589 RepID=A0A448ZFK5_9STRA|nr:unnamed protein product [Pseudo-nitzschia multistriata]